MRINGRFNQKVYCEYLSGLTNYIEEHFDDGIVYFLHDNHLCHTSGEVKQWFRQNIGIYENLVIPHPR
jgi:hypothetical protein